MMKRSEIRDQRSKIVRAVVDRVEGALAVLELEGKGDIVWPIKFLPEDLRPGNILDITISLNQEAEKTQRDKIKKLQERLKNR